MMSLLSVLLASSAVLFSLGTASQAELSLNGDEWTISDAEGRVKDLQAVVPGQVHLDLLRHNIIPNPYYGYNDVKLQWIAYDNWVYRRTVHLDDSVILERDVYLKCDGLDTVANISLNGEPVGYANSFHKRYLFNITGIAVPGMNKLEIEFESAANYSWRLSHAYPYPVPAPGIYVPNASRNFIRKPQSDFGWDWGPAFMPIGIWQNISIISFDRVYVSYVIPNIVYDPVAVTFAPAVKVCVMVPGLALGIEHYNVLVSLTIERVGMVISKEFEVSVSGESCQYYEAKPTPLNEDTDKLTWWPHSSLHPTPTLLLATTDIKILDPTGGQVNAVTDIKRVGYRSIELMQPVPPDGSIGSLMYFSVRTSKGVFPLYSKGSNLIPLDAFVSRAGPDYVRRVLTAALIGNQNMIRIWGGGLYQPDWLYDMCDEMGLMVWQEFMFAVALYPRDIDFLDNVRDEVQHQVRRLGHHASIMLWSGNNENQAYAQDDPMYLVDYSILYDQTVRGTLWKEDMSRPYWPSSPSNGALVDDPSRGLYIQRWGDSANLTMGDLHRYDYFDLCNNVSTFPRPRFASEFGFQSYPSFHSISSVSSAEDWNNTSPLMAHRQHHPDGAKQLVDMMSRLFHLPDNSNQTQQFIDFIYLTQVVQSICIGSEAEHYRRILSETGYTRGTLYWQLNDIWQAQTWSSLEYGGRWKLLHYAMKKLYSELFVSAYQLYEYISVYVVNDQAELTISYNIEMRVVLWKDGSTVDHFSKNGQTVGGFEGIAVFNMSSSDVFKKATDKEAFLVIEVTNTTSGSVMADTVFYPTSFTEVDLPTSNITMSDISVISSTTASFKLSSTTVAPYVMIDSGSIDGYFSDNGFLMLPGTHYTIVFTTWQSFTAQDLRNSITIRTVRDTYKQ